MPHPTQNGVILECSCQSANHLTDTA